MGCGRGDLMYVLISESGCIYLFDSRLSGWGYDWIGGRRKTDT